MQVTYSPKAAKEFKKLDKSIQKQIKKYTDELQRLSNPRDRGKALSGNLGGLWRYRVGDYRLICTIEDDGLIVLTLEIRHRNRVYG